MAEDPSPGNMSADTQKTIALLAETHRWMRQEVERFTTDAAAAIVRQTLPVIEQFKLHGGSPRALDEAARQSMAHLPPQLLHQAALLKERLAAEATSRIQDGLGTTSAGEDPHLKTNALRLVWSTPAEPELVEVSDPAITSVGIIVCALVAVAACILLAVADLTAWTPLGLIGGYVVMAFVLKAADTPIRGLRWPGLLWLYGLRQSRIEELRSQQGIKIYAALFRDLENIGQQMTRNAAEPPGPGLLAATGLAHLGSELPTGSHEADGMIGALGHGDSGDAALGGGDGGDGGGDGGGD